MAISTYGVQLMKGTGTEIQEDDKPTGIFPDYESLVDIKAFPDMGAAPQSIETTTLSDAAQTFINGVETTAALEFTANYDVEYYESLIALKDTETGFALYFGNLGDAGKFAFKGYISAWVVGAGVNGVVEMRISILPTTPIKKVPA